MRKVTNINCLHPINLIRVVFHLEKTLNDDTSNSYHVEKATAHCIECNSNLQETDKNGRMAIDIAFSAKEPHERLTSGRTSRRVRSITTS
jgi:hypothetical protein